MEIFTPLFQAVIAFVVFLTGLGFVFSLLLGPVKENQVRLEKRMDGFDNELKAGQAKLESKIDRLLAKS